MISKHSYNNDLFKSLSKVLDKETQVEKTAQSEVSKEIFNFTEQTKEAFNQAISEHDETIIKELSWHADRSKTRLSSQEVSDFIKTARRQGYRGKTLEREAHKYVDKVSRDGRPVYSGTTHLDYQEIDENTSDKSVLSASYSPDSVNDSKTGGYMWQSKNPNSIWDSEALRRQATVALAGEKIKTEKEAEAKFKEDQKKAETEQLRQVMADSSLGNRISNSGSSTQESEPVGDQKLAANSMSMFDTDRDFEDIPEKTVGETIKKDSEARSEKKKSSRKEWDHSTTPVKRASIDNFFEQLL